MLNGAPWGSPETENFAVFALEDPCGSRRTNAAPRASLAQAVQLVQPWRLRRMQGRVGTKDLSTVFGENAFENACVTAYHMYLASSTAQGGGGSFKNRKPIGEVGCCESGMAKRIH